MSGRLGSDRCSGACPAGVWTCGAPRAGGCWGQRQLWERPCRKPRGHAVSLISLSLSLEWMSLPNFLLVHLSPPPGKVLCF